MATFTIRPNDQGTRGTWTAQGGGTTNLHQSIDDYLAGGSKDDDTTYVEGPNNADSSMFVLLEDTPAGFDPANITAIEIKSAYRKNEAGVSGSPDTVALFYQLFRSDETTAITTELSKGNITSTTYAEATDSLTGTGSHTKSDWDGATLRIRQDYTVAGCADTTTRLRVTAVEITVTYTEATVASPGVGAATWEGFAAAVIIGTVAATGLGGASWTGFAPAVNTTINVGLGEATWTGFEPTVTVGITNDVRVREGADSKVTSTQIDFRVTPDVGAATWSGFAPTVTASDHITVSTGLGEATWTGLAPTVTASNHITVTAGLGAATWEGFVPTVTASNHITVAPGLGAATWTGFAPSANVGNAVTASPGLGQATWAGFAPTISATQHVTVAPGVGAATWAGFAPTVSVTNHVSVTPGTGSATWDGFAPTIQTPVTVSVGLGEATWTGFVPTITVAPTEPPETISRLIVTLANSRNSATVANSIGGVTVQSSRTSLGEV